MECKAPTSHTSRRVVLFGGQGSQSVFSPVSLSILEGEIASSPAVSLLASKCHVAFLEEILTLCEEEKRVLGLDLDAFSHPRSLIHVESKYQDHAVIQSTTLCLHQLLHYLEEKGSNEAAFQASFDDIVEATGFCAGLIPAAVVASARSVREFIAFGVESFRLAFWVGYRTMIQSLNYRRNGCKEATWSLVISGLEQAKIEHTIKKASEQSTCRTLRISALSHPNVVSVTGSPNDLSVLKSLLGPQTTKFANVQAWYHGGDQLEAVVSQLRRDLVGRNIHFPSVSDIVKPLRSTLDASMFGADSSDEQLDLWVIRHLLIHSVNWNSVFGAILRSAHQILQDQNDAYIEIDSFGPSSHFLLAGAKAYSDHPRLQFRDLSSFASESSKSGKGTGQQSVAIVGMGLDLPDGRTPDALWHTLSHGLSAIREVPESRFDLKDYIDSEESSKPRSLHAKHGAFLDDIWRFDNGFFSISPREAMSMDPQQRILLHTAQAALDDAGYVQDSTPSFQRKSMGCYIGVATGDYTDNLRDNIDAFYSPGNAIPPVQCTWDTKKILIGTLRAFHSGRLSYVHSLSGPCMTTDTACSSSLVSIYQACRALQQGDCTSALAGGVNAICSPDMYLGLDKGHFLSSTGGCKSFDVSADGYSRAEGSVVFVLKRLSDAIAENDRIHGIIKDVAVNQSGNARSITHPHSETQVMLYKDLLHRTGVQPSSVSVIEAHGTGTQAGDVREISSLQTVFGDYHSEGHPLMVSSIKGNIGHCEAASGAAGLAKLLLMLRNEVIPMQVGLTNLNPKLTDVGDGRLSIPRQNQSWPSTKYLPRRAMLNNFGAAGSNAALLLEEHKSPQREERHEISRSSYVFCLSAKTLDAFHRTVRDHQRFLSQKIQATVKDLCYTATARRHLYEHRIAIPCSSIEDLRAKLDHYDTSKIRPANLRGTTVFIFSGQGSVYTGMGKELMQTCTSFKECILYCDDIVRSVGGPSILTHFDDEATETLSDLEEVIASQCACVALEYALGMLLLSWNIVPSYTIGHSLGEFAALAISGAFTIQDAMRLVASRAKLMTVHCTATGSGMTACKLNSREADAMLAESAHFSGLSVACRNSNNDCVVSGASDSLKNFEEACSEKNIKAKRLDVPYGFHSASMDPILGPLNDLGASMKWSKPSIPIISTVFGRTVSPDTDFKGDYLALHASQPVLFEDCIRKLSLLTNIDNALCLEVGPHPISLPMIRSTAISKAACCVPTLQKGIPAWKALSTALCDTIAVIDNVDWRKVFASSHAIMTDLPGYPLDGKTFKVPYRESSTGALERASSPSPSYVDTGLQFLPKMIPVTEGHSFETTTDLLAPLILGHNVGGTAICPASVFLELGLEGARAALDIPTHDVLVATSMRFANPLVYAPSDDPKKIRVHITDKAADNTLSFRVGLLEPLDQAETLCCSGDLSIKNVQALESRWIRDAAIVRRQIDYLLGSRDVPTSRFQKRVLYDVVFTRVVKYSQEYQSLSELSISETSLEGIGSFKVPNVSESSNRPDVFVRWCDVLLHSAGCIANLRIGQDEIGICSNIESIEILYDTIDFNNTFSVYCSLIDAVKGAIIADAFAVNPRGEVVGIIRGMEFKRLRLSNFQRMLQPNAISKHTSQATTLAPNSGSATPTSSQPHPETSSQSIKDTLTSILAEISGAQKQDLDYSSSLEALGIDSMMQIELTTKLKEAYPVSDLDHNALSTSENLHELEATICSMVGSATSTPEISTKSGSTSDAGGTDSPRTIASESSLSEGAQTNLTSLHKSFSGHPPLVLFHDGSGMVEPYSTVREFDRDLLAFYDPHFPSSKPHFSSINDMTAQYISHLSQATMPSLIVGGWSFGGVVAYEAARQLNDLGFNVKGLILIDSPFPVNHQPLPKEVISHFAPNNALSDEFTQNANLLSRYVPPNKSESGLSLRSDFKIAILKSQDVFDTESLCNIRYDWLSQQETRAKAVNDWMDLLGVKAKVMTIKGNHFEPFAPENIADTSLQLRKACQYIDEA